MNIDKFNVFLDKRKERILYTEKYMYTKSVNEGKTKKVEKVEKLIYNVYEYYRKLIGGGPSMAC